MYESTGQHMLNVIMFGDYERMYGLTFARNDSFFGRNVLYCADWYCCTVCDTLQGSINSINLHVQLTKFDVYLQTANLLSELLNNRDGRDLLLANVKRWTVWYHLFYLYILLLKLNYIDSMCLVKFYVIINVCTLRTIFILNYNYNNKDVNVISPLAFISL